MKVLFAVSNEEISESIIKKYQKLYKQIISYKNVYYFNAILKELQKDKSYDRVVISEDLEAFTHTQYDQIDKFIFEKLDSISDEASNMMGNDTPIILICSDRRTKSEQMLVKLFGIGIYNAIIGTDRSVDEVCRLINRPRTKKDAKIYYKIDSEEVSYQTENENDVSEMEIQNILAHYKRLGKNEDKYIESFDNIAAQYNDTQLRIISKFLPLNVRAVLEEKSDKYQKIMSFNNKVSNEIRIKKEQKKDDGPSQILLKTNNRETIMSKPVVIPSAVNMNAAKRLSRPKPYSQQIQTQQENKIENNEKQLHYNNIKENVEPINNKNAYINNTKEPKAEQPVIEQPVVKQSINKNELQTQEIVEPVKRGRGRPRKNPISQPQENASTVKRGRGRPRKNQSVNQDNINSEEIILPGFEESNNDNYYKQEEANILPGFEESNNDNYYKQEETNILPGFEESNNDNYYKQEETTILPGFEESNNDNYYKQEETNILPGFEENNNNYNKQEEISESINFENSNIGNSYVPNNTVSNYNTESYNEDYLLQKSEELSNTDLSYLLTPDKKVITFLGTTKNGTSFIVNNLAEIMSSMGVNTAILDTTQNRNSYYIYTKNEEQLRQIAATSVQGLSQGVARGINVNKNLTVYTALPNENESIKNVDKILETLLKNYSLVLIDTDFNTPKGYFKQSQETYLVQTMDILTIQPLTAFLRELKSKNILDEKKLKIVLNKYVKIKGIKDETIIGGIAFYNDPSMSFMTELFDRTRIKYVAIPFEQEIYTKYLEGIIECEISLKGYSKEFLQALRTLGNMVYPIANAGNSKANYVPPSIGETRFSNNMNDTLDKMKRNF